MIVESTAEDYAALLRGVAPRNYRLAETAVAPPEIIEMLAGVAGRVWEAFSPASWLIVEQGEVVGLCSITRPPAQGEIDIGYGIAPTRRRQGHAGRAVRDIVAWARKMPGVAAITAETAVANLPSQRVLEASGFVRCGERIDDEDGPLFCWRCRVD